jgi:putative component of toxin-antitoxin plasmid stabilization module
MYRGLHNLIYSTPYCDSRKEFSDWLKSLKDRYTWKPSNEQIKALSAINVTGRISYVGQGQELINLYNDLKKLKEG